MGFSGHELGNQGEMIAKAGMVRSQVTDATRLSPDRVHRETPRWPRGATAVRVVLVGLLAVIVTGWVLTALNSW